MTDREAGGGDWVRYLTPAAAARRVGLPRSVVDQALRDGALSYLQPHGDRGWRLIHPADLEEWVERVRVPRKG